MESDDWKTVFVVLLGALVGILLTPTDYGDDEDLKK